MPDAEHQTRSAFGRLRTPAAALYPEGQPQADIVLFTRIGDLWPLDAKTVDEEISRFRVDDAYQEVASGPLFAFRRKHGPESPP